MVLLKMMKTLAKACARKGSMVILSSRGPMFESRSEVMFDSTFFTLLLLVKTIQNRFVCKHAIFQKYENRLNRFGPLTTPCLFS